MKYNVILRQTVFFIAILLLVASCENELNRVVKKKFPNGQERLVVFYDGEPAEANVVRIHVYYPNGQLFSVKRYKAGKLSGLTESWYKNGAPMAKTPYENDKREGEFVKYHPNGKPEMKGVYKNNRKQGMWVELSLEGDTLSTARYDKGVLQK